MDKKKNENLNNLKSILIGFGIKSNEQLDEALSDALDTLEVGIMTKKLIAKERGETA